MKAIFYLLALLSGMGVALQAGINAKLRFSLNSPILSSFISFLVGALGLLLAYIITVKIGLQSVPSAEDIKQTSFWMWFGGLLGAFYMFISVLAIPKIGVGNVMSLVITGQIILAVMLDHFGVFGNTRPITLFRGIGICLMSLGVYIVQRF